MNRDKLQRERDKEKGSGYRNNSVLGPINSWIFRILSAYFDRIFGTSKRRLFHDHPDTVVEIGPGSGANMRYLRKGTHLIAIEPNIHMHSNLRKCANKYGIDLEIRTIIGEEIDLPDSSCEFVISTLVLCTVQDPVACVNQIRRILKPHGRFVFIEHVRAREHSLLAFIQKIFHKPWHWFFEGCNTNRDISSIIMLNGFSTTEIEAYNLYTPFIPITPQIRGTAIK
jgi:SAM-dependent methyltransferase